MLVEAGKSSGCAIGAAAPARLPISTPFIFCAQIRWAALDPNPHGGCGSPPRRMRVAWMVDGGGEEDEGGSSPCDAALPGSAGLQEAVAAADGGGRRSRDGMASSLLVAVAEHQRRVLEWRPPLLQHAANPWLPLKSPLPGEADNHGCSIVFLDSSAGSSLASSVLPRKNPRLCILQRPPPRGFLDSLLGN